MRQRFTNIERASANSMLLYLGLYQEWERHALDEVSPTLSHFFASIDLDAPFLLNWARWLHFNQQTDDGGYPVDTARAERLVEAAKPKDATLAVQVSRMVRGEPIGAQDPGQLHLF